MIILDRLGDFNEVIEYYEKVLEIVSNMKLYGKIDTVEKKIKELSDDKYMVPAMRAVFMNYSLELMQLEELIKRDVSDEVIDNFVEQEWILDNVFELAPITKQEKIRQIRNCLAHAMYEIRINDEFDLDKKDVENQNNSASFYINNGKIRALIPYNIGLNLPHVYKSIYMRNYEENKQFIKFNVRKLEDGDGKKSINTFARSIKLGEKSIDEENIKLVKAYIEWIGLENFKKINYFTKYEILSDMVGLSNNGVFLNDRVLVSNLGSMFLDTIRHYRHIDDKTTVTGGFAKDYLLSHSLNKFSYQIPQVYANVLMGMCNYCFSYVREINENRGEKLFEYRDIDLSGINISSQGNEIFVKEINLNSKLVEKRKEKASIQKRRAKIDNIPDLDKRQKAMEKSKDKYEEGEKREKELDIEIEELIRQISESGEIIYDSSNFFRHLRNSISHGRYRVDYMKFFRTKKLEDMQVTFRDYNEQTNLVEFEASMSVKKVMELIKFIQEKINHSIEKSTIGNNVQTSFLEQALVHFCIGEKELEEETDIEKGRVVLIDKV